MAYPALCSAADYTSLLKAASPIEPVGIFSAAIPSARLPGLGYGYDIDLSHSADCYFGVPRATDSREGGAPADTIVFNHSPTQNAISFSAKFSLGVVNLGPNRANVPSKDLFNFSGVFNQNHKQINGTFNYTDKLGSQPTMTQKVRLTMIKNSVRTLELPGNAMTYSAWLDSSAQTLKVYGPKW